LSSTGYAATLGCIQVVYRVFSSRAITIVIIARIIAWVVSRVYPLSILVVLASGVEDMGSQLLGRPGSAAYSSWSARRAKQAQARKEERSLVSHCSSHSHLHLLVQEDKVSHLNLFCCQSCTRSIDQTDDCHDTNPLIEIFHCAV
jgi:hypothetical protein